MHKSFEVKKRNENIGGDKVASVEEAEKLFLGIQQKNPISTQKYKDGGAMEKSIFDLTIKIRNQKQLMKTTKVKDVVGAFVTKLRDLKTKMVFFYKNLPPNENDDSFDGNVNDINYKIKIMKLHDTGWNFFLFLCLVIGVVCLSILNFIIRI